MDLLSGIGKPIVIAQSRAHSPFSIVVHDHESDTVSYTHLTLPTKRIV